MTAAAGSIRPASTLGLGAQLGYGVGQIAGQIFRDVPSLLLLFFMTTVLGIAPAVAGVAIFVPKLVWGVGCDMLVGVFSDRWRHRIARRYWLLAGAFGAPVAMVLLFHVPEGSTGLRVAYVAGVFSLYMAVFASFSVPYLAISGELTSDPRQRNVIMAWRLVFTAAGVLISGMLAPAIIQAQGGGQAAYETMALVLAIICPVALVIAFFGVGHASAQSAYVAPAETRTRLSPRAALGVLLVPRFSVLLSANLLQLTGAGMGYASLLYFLTYNMGRSDAFQLIGGIVMAACVGIVVSQPLWVQVAARIGKRRAYIAATLLFAATYAVWAFAAGWGTLAAYALSFVMAVGNAGWTMLGFSMMSDIASDDDRHAGLYSAAWIASDKIAFALGGTLLVGLMLSAFGFDSAKAVAGLPQSPTALIGVMAAFGLAPAALNVIGALIMTRWNRN
ncbi:MFS transporter [Glacieibacterium frigidum]|uniref:MFS transporter n=1 Tax=Glacieibacterium frigidum TaxID=2593303 RepID=A0A552U894_9SPHN|nr:MFS transporter [Glacieibacterium frigidum]TRW14438.1 MFS transporter [Glacieibacterium frigidum]